MEENRNQEGGEIFLSYIYSLGVHTPYQEKHETEKKNHHTEKNNTRHHHTENTKNKQNQTARAGGIGGRVSWYIISLYKRTLLLLSVILSLLRLRAVGDAHTQHHHTKRKLSLYIFVA